MVRETVDTNFKNNREIADGTWDFVVDSCTKKYGGTAKDVPFYILKVRYQNGDGEQALMPNMMGPLLRLLGAKEVEPNKFDFDTDDFFNFRFTATISREQDKKDSTKMRQKMSDFKKYKAKKDEAEIPF
jgi:hypothetical protein